MSELINYLLKNESLSSQSFWVVWMGLLNKNIRSSNQSFVCQDISQAGTCAIELQLKVSFIAEALCQWHISLSQSAKTVRRFRLYILQFNFAIIHLNIIHANSRLYYILSRIKLDQFLMRYQAPCPKMQICFFYSRLFN